VERRLAQGRGADPRRTGPALWALAGIGIAAAALVVYAAGHAFRPYDHFVWQADAYLHGRVAIPWPVPGTSHFQDVLPVIGGAGLPTGEALIPFPPLPAIVLLPFVAVWGVATDQQAIAVVLGAMDVAICWWMLGGLPVSGRVRVASTVFFAFGTVFWYAAQLGTTWYFAHVVAVALGLLAVGVAVRADAAAASTGEPEAPGSERWTSSIGLDRRQFLAGLLLGLAATSRLTIAFGLPFLALVGAGGSLRQRMLSAVAGAAIPIAVLFGYNVLTSGSPLHAGYQYLYRVESVGYPSLGYRSDWAVEDPRYLPGNAALMLFSTPILFPPSDPSSLGPRFEFCTQPGDERGLFNRECPLAVPRDTGMSLLLTSPAYLLALPLVVRRYRRSRLVAGATVAIVLVAVVNLMHFSQGWVQFGYRFSNDFVFFALPLVALAVERAGRRGRLAAGLLIVVSVGVNYWGVTWGRLLGW
jgi:hypothetical protein